MLCQWTWLHSFVFSCIWIVWLPFYASISATCICSGYVPVQLIQMCTSYNFELGGKLFDWTEQPLKRIDFVGHHSRWQGVLVLRHGHISDRVEMHYFFKSLLQSLLQGMIQTKYLVPSNDDQGRVYQNCQFHDSRGWGSYARAWPMQVMTVKVHYLPLYQHTAHCLQLYWGIVMLLS